MKTLVSFFLAVGLMASPSLAQTIRVQSGDHADFTRLVLDIGADREWNLEPQGDTQWTLTLVPAIEGYDISGTFDLIQRARLTALTADDRLSLSLGCECTIDSFRFDGRYLVIDISDPDPEAPSPASSTADLSTGADDSTSTTSLPDLADLLLTPRDLPSVSPVHTLAGRGPSEEGIEFSEEAANQGAASTPNPRLAEAAQIMAEQLARAAASGLLDASLGQPFAVDDPSPIPEPVLPTNRESELSELDSAPSPNTALASEIEGGFPQGPLPIRAEAAFDVAIQRHAAIGAPPETSSCASAPFDVRDWASDTRFSQHLGERRLALFDDRDVLNADGVTQLAQYYIYFGFGAEARYWLTQLTDPPTELLHVAAIVDGATSAPFPSVDTPEACSQGELLWRYMAGALPAEVVDATTAAAVLRAYGELPTTLRDQMGPRLARKMADDRQIETARNIRDALQRSGRVEPAVLRLLDFDLGIAPDAPSDQIRSDLAETLRDDGSAPVDVMTHALAFDRSIGLLPETARVVAAEALLREHGEGPETAGLWHEIVLAHAALGQIDRAMAMLDDPSRIGPIRAEALTGLMADRVAVGDIAALMILAYTHGSDWRPEGSTAGRIQVQAIAILRDAGLVEAAQILRDVRQPLILPIADTPETGPLDDSRTAWRDANWTRLAETGSGPHSEIATRMVALAVPEAPPITEPTLAPDLDSLSASVDDSRALRATVGELLYRPTPP